nr:MAG TPA: hypothetical protein [Caudoviricetes sp.]
MGFMKTTPYSLPLMTTRPASTLPSLMPWPTLSIRLAAST